MTGNAQGLGLCAGQHRVGSTIRLDQDDVLTITGKAWCGPLERRDILLLFDNGGTMTLSELRLNTGNRFAPLAAAHGRELA